MTSSDTRAEDCKDFLLPKDKNGIPYETFLVTVKNIIKEEDKTHRYLIFAKDGGDAYIKILNHFKGGQYGIAAFRITTEMVKVVAGRAGIIEL